MAKNWFCSLLTNSLIRVMSKQYLQFRHERVGDGETDQKKRAVRGGGESILFNADLFTYISLVCLMVCPFIPYLEILRGSISCFGSFPVLVAFVYKQPIYNCTATENEFIVYYGIWCILKTKFSYGFTLPWIKPRY